MKKRKQDEETLADMEEDYAQEIADGLKAAFKDSKIAKDYLWGGFTPAELEWVREELERMKKSGYRSYQRSGVQRNRDRRRKFSVRRRIAKATATLGFSAYLAPAFDEDEWSEMLPPVILCKMLYLGCLRGGYDYALPLADSIEKGLNEYLKIETEGIMNAKLALSLHFSEKGLMETTTRVGNRVIELLKEESAEEAKEERRDRPTPSPNAKTPDEVAEIQKEKEGQRTARE